MVNLDDPKAYQRLDPSNMISRIGDMAQQCRRAWGSASVLPLPSSYSYVNKVIILGMGGSAVGGDMVESLAITQSDIPIVVNKDYHLPKWVDEQTLVIASSYSGNTEETISAFLKALETPAKKLVITTGGRLQELAAQNSVPLFVFHYEAEPRAAFGYSFFCILAFLQNLGLITIKPKYVAEATSALDELSAAWYKTVPLQSNPAKQLANDLFNHAVVIYGAGILSKMAYRWKTQLNECSKTWASAEVFPELNHNTIVGYNFPKNISESAFVVMLRPTQLKQRLKIRFDVTRELLDKAGIQHTIVKAKGTNHLSQLMSTVLYGDYVSYYLAILNEIDPSPVEAIDYLKSRLASLSDTP
jgi:glucose/mannose-6-phosphate isomerase